MVVNHVQPKLTWAGELNIWIITHVSLIVFQISSKILISMCWPTKFEDTQYKWTMNSFARMIKCISLHHWIIGRNSTELHAKKGLNEVTNNNAW